ncbi:hypothetical protein [Lacticaseibacillus paracasei]|uniref:hypothetical protein n=1 Tax=Lacticaseibacillus paracasei TaxID=1597 RepID=UPI004045DD47
MNTLPNITLQSNASLVIAHNDSLLSNDAWISLLHEFLTKIQFKQLLEDTLQLEDRRKFHSTSYPDMLTMKIMLLILGYDNLDCNNKVTT